MSVLFDKNLSLIVIWFFFYFNASKWKNKISLGFTFLSLLAHMSRKLRQAVLNIHCLSSILCLCAFRIVLLLAEQIWTKLGTKCSCKRRIEFVFEMLSAGRAKFQVSRNSVSICTFNCMLFFKGEQNQETIIIFFKCLRVFFYITIGLILIKLNLPNTSMAEESLWWRG